MTMFSVVLSSVAPNLGSSSGSSSLLIYEWVGNKFLNDLSESFLLFCRNSLLLERDVLEMS